MPGTPGTLWRRLRSRRLAVSLIVAVVAYAMLATFIPQGRADSAGVEDWARENPGLESAVAPLGLHQAFSGPVFLVLIGLLTLATAACAVERTRHASRLVRSGGSLDPADRRRLIDRPDFVFELSPHLDSGFVLESAASALASRGMRLRTGVNIVEARKGAWGAWGSPLFHWALVLLFVVVAMGRATRAEGVMGIRVGESVRDAPDGYLYIDPGPLFGNGYTGYELRVDELLMDYRLDGISRGIAPTITLLRGDVPVRTQRVYPNNPLRHGPLLVHTSDNGVAATFSVESSSGVQVGRIPFLLDFAPDATSTIPVEYSVVDETGTGLVDVRAVMPLLADDEGRLIRAVPILPTSIIETAPPGTSDYGPPSEVLLGEGILLQGNQYFRFVSADDWVKVTVANDWSVPYIYLLFILAVAGLAISVQVAPSRVLVAAVRSNGASALRVTVRNARRDPMFSRLVFDAISDAVADRVESGGGAEVADIAVPEVPGREV